MHLMLRRQDACRRIRLVPDLDGRPWTVRYLDGPLRGRIKCWSKDFAGWWDWRGLVSIAAHLLIDGTRIGTRWPGIMRQSSDWLGIIDDQAFHVVSFWLMARGLA